MQLRYYQTDAVNSLYNHLLTKNTNPCIVIPTGGGKTPVMAQICRDVVERWNGRVVVLAHVKELLEQTYGHLMQTAPDLDIGLYSAGLRKRNTKSKILVAGIQSVYEKAEKIGAADLILVDEAHLIPNSGYGRYQTFIRDMQSLSHMTRVAGLTATPYRLDSGMICGEGNILNEICYEIDTRKLIREGFLSPLVSIQGHVQPDTESVGIKGGEYDSVEIIDEMTKDQIVRAACEEIVGRTKSRKSVLVFCQSLSHMDMVERELEEMLGHPVTTVSGDTHPTIRAEAVRKFKSGEIRFLLNVGVYTTGFDAPNVDCVVLLRATLSPGLFYQMVGRGFRKSPGKEDCLILDFGNNIRAHGPIHDIKGHVEAKTWFCPQCTTSNMGPKCSKCNMDEPAKPKEFWECPLCETHNPATERKCCGFQCTYEKPVRKVTHQHRPDDYDINGELGGRVQHKVVDVYYCVHRKKGYEGILPPTMRVDYLLEGGSTQSEWVCFEHDGFARRKAESWWQARSNDPIPDTVANAVDAANNGALAMTEWIIVEKKPDSRFASVVFAKFGEKPPRVDEGDDFLKSAKDMVSSLDPDDCPF